MVPVQPRLLPSLCAVQRVRRFLHRRAAIVLGAATLVGGDTAPLLASAVSPPPLQSRPATASLEVDPTTVLRIGSLAVSRYALEKQHRQFLARTAEQGQPPPDTAATAAWMEQFLIRQIVTAHALTRGYDTHPEVTRLVDTMERHMLSQAEGPYYRTLYDAAAALSAETIARHRQGVQRQLDVVVLSLPASARATLLPSGWETASTAERLASLATLRTAAGAEFYEGWTGWPFPPADHATDALCAARPGDWLEAPLDALPEPRTVLIHVRAERPLPAPPDATAAERSFTLVLEQHRKRQLQHAHRLRVLRTARFDFDSAGATALLARLAALPPETFELTPSALGPVLSAPLCRYEDALGAQTVSGDAWREAFNRLFLRQLPADLPSLRRSAEDVVLARLDEAAARQLGLDRTPQFVEDRRNFHSAQVLDLFEREQLLPSVHVSEEAIAAFYAAHAASFPALPTASVRRRRFPSEAEATAWLRRQDSAASEGTPADPTASSSAASAHSTTTGLLCEDRFEISPAQTLPEAPQFTFALLHAGEPAAAGPVAVGADYVVYVKDGPTREVRPALPAVAAEIRHRLTRQALDARLRELAREVAHTLPREDHLPYEQFGLAQPPAP